MFAMGKIVKCLGGMIESKYAIDNRYQMMPGKTGDIALGLEMNGLHEKTPIK